jgi:hypothetical protein
LNEYGIYFIALPSKRIGVTLNVAGLTFTYRYAAVDNNNNNNNNKHLYSAQTKTVLGALQ